MTVSLAEATAAARRIADEHCWFMLGQSRLTEVETDAHKLAAFVLAGDTERLRTALDAALDSIDAPYPLSVFPERDDDTRRAIFEAMRTVDKHATEWFYAHVARHRGEVARQKAADALVGGSP